MSRKITKKLIKAQLAWTDACFRRALLTHYDEFLSKEEKQLPCNELKRLILLDWREQVRTPEINEIYMKFVLAMSTERLSIIAEVFQAGKQYRSPLTIEAIMTELFERSANPETRKQYE